jgi:hypothetical protein
MMIVMMVVVMAIGQLRRLCGLARQAIGRDAKSQGQSAHSAKLVAGTILMSARLARQCGLGRASPGRIRRRVPRGLGSEALHGLHGSLYGLLTGRRVPHVGA